MKTRLPTDIDLLSQMQADDQKALLLLMKKYDRELFRFICRKTSSPENAQEAVQDIFISLWGNRYNLNITDSLSPYLYKAAKHKIIDFYIASGKEIMCYEATLPEYQDAIAPPPDEAIVTAQLHEWFTGEVEKMPETVKNVFRLSRQEQLPVKDIAKKLSLSEQTVKNNLTFALKRLQMRLTRADSLYIAFVFIVRLILQGRQ
jgi:RNA polymerase sigma-70 factor (ECF subfamily)